MSVLRVKSPAWSSTRDVIVDLYINWTKPALEPDNYQILVKDFSEPLNKRNVQPPGVSPFLAPNLANDWEVLETVT